MNSIPTASPTVRIVFRPRTARFLFAIIIGGFVCGVAWLIRELIVSGELVDARFGPWVFVVVFGFMGSLAVVVGLHGLVLRVIVNEYGITKSSLMLDGFAIKWDKIRSWKVVDSKLEDSFTLKAVEIEIIERKKPLIIYDSEVWRPSFEAFVDCLRRGASEKETQV